MELEQQEEVHQHQEHLLDQEVLVKQQQFLDLFQLRQVMEHQDQHQEDILQVVVVEVLLLVFLVLVVLFAKRGIYGLIAGGNGDHG